MKAFHLITTLLLAAPAAWGSATFDAASGTGQVAGRDVQNVLGWTDAQLQERAPAVSFSYRSSGQYTGVCAWTNAQGVRVEERRTGVVNWQSSLNASLRHDPRNPRRVEGFQLLGFSGSPTRGEAMPMSGAVCTGAGGIPGAWLAVVPQLQSDALLAHFGGVEVRLPF